MTQKRLFSVAYLKEIIERDGPAYYAKIVAENERILKEYEEKKKEEEYVHTDRGRKDSIRKSD